MPTLSTLDARFSKVIRQWWADAHGNVRCYTCNLIRHWKEMDCGHYIPKGRSRSVRWHHNNARPQCRFCNSEPDGRRARFRERLIGEIGEDALIEMEQLSRKVDRCQLDEHSYNLERLEAALKQKLSEQ